MLNCDFMLSAKGINAGEPILNPLKKLNGFSELRKGLSFHADARMISLTQHLAHVN